jgi:hypothetical protein
LKGKLPANQTFQGGGWLILFQRGLFCCVENTHISLQRKPLGLEAGASPHFFPVRIELVLER